MKGHQWQWFYKIEQDFSFYLSDFLFLLELGSLNGVGLILMEQWSVSKVWVYIVHLRGSVRKINFVHIRQSQLFFRSEFWNPAGFVPMEIFLTNQIVSDERKMKSCPNWSKYFGIGCWIWWTIFYLVLIPGWTICPLVSLIIRFLK